MKISDFPQTPPPTPDFGMILMGSDMASMGCNLINLILNMGSHMATNEGISMTTNFRICMTTKVRINMTTNFQFYDSSCSAI